MMVITCTKCGGWIVVVANEHDRASPFLAAAEDEAKKPDRKCMITKGAYDEQAYGLISACPASYGKKPDCTSTS
jgi:hypothetical protein